MLRFALFFKYVELLKDVGRAAKNESACRSVIPLFFSDDEHRCTSPHFNYGIAQKGVWRGKTHSE